MPSWQIPAFLVFFTDKISLCPHPKFYLRFPWSSTLTNLFIYECFSWSHKRLLKKPGFILWMFEGSWPSTWLGPSYFECHPGCLSPSQIDPSDQRSCSDYLDGYLIVLSLVMRLQVFILLKGWQHSLPGHVQHPQHCLRTNWCLRSVGLLSGLQCIRFWRAML